MCKAKLIEHIGKLNSSSEWEMFKVALLTGQKTSKIFKMGSAIQFIGNMQTQYNKKIFTEVDQRIPNKERVHHHID